MILNLTSDHGIGMTRLWEAEQTIEPEIALKLIQKQFPEINAHKIRLLGAGWDNTAFVVNEEMIFRFPRRQVALPLLDAEWAILPKLAPHLPIAIPVPQWRGVPTEEFPWSFIGYPMLPGVTACYANLSNRERTALAEPIAHFLALLHGTSVSEVPREHLPEDHLKRIDPQVILEKLTKNFNELSVLGLLHNRKQLENVIEKSNKFRDPIYTSIVHGDFYVRHLLLNEKHDLAGVIDWGDVHFGDIAIDLAVAHNFLPPEAHDMFRKSYWDITEDTWRLARLRAILSSTYLALFGHHSGDRDIAREGLWALDVISKAIP